MRWVEKDGPSHMQNRTRRIFLLFPLILGGQYRWMEWATVGETYITERNGNRGWRKDRWLD